MQSEGTHVVTGYFTSPWAAEDSGPARLASTSAPAPSLNAPLARTTRRTLMSTMTVLGAPGDVFLLTHSVLGSNFGLPTSARVERIDPITLAPLARSPQLPGGPMWPGGVAVHANGDLYTVYGRFAHRLDRDCRVKAARELPIDQPHNSFVILPGGMIVTKNLSDKTPARLSVLDPETLAIVASLDCPEPSIARLSADGTCVYVVGTRSIMRCHWDGKALAWDDWRHDYTSGTQQSYGWDVVLALGHAWFMDNGRHRYRTSMIGRGVSPTANRLIRVSLNDARDTEATTISGLSGGSITNPPLIDPARRIAIGFDSANSFMRAWTIAENGVLSPLWEKPGIGCASHMILLPAAGRIVTNDYDGTEQVVVLDIMTGAEIARVRVGGMTQGVVFPSLGWNDDVYWCSMRRVARIFSA